MLGTSQLMAAIDFHSISFRTKWMSMAAINCLVTSIPQNLFCIRQKK